MDKEALAVDVLWIHGVLAYSQWYKGVFLDNYREIGIIRKLQYHNKYVWKSWFHIQEVFSHHTWEELARVDPENGIISVYGGDYFAEDGFERAAGKLSTIYNRPVRCRIVLDKPYLNNDKKQKVWQEFDLNSQQPRMLDIS